jgi:hypothetical protein
VAVHLPLLVFFQDQCSIGWAASQWLGQFLLLALFSDIFHREWNSVKNACKKTRVFLWATVTQMTVVFNSSRAPWSSQAFWRTKQDAFNHMLRHGVRSDIFAEMLPDVCKELQVPIPRTDEDLEVSMNISTTICSHNNTILWCFRSKGT